MEVHQRLFESAGSRPEERIVGSNGGLIPTLCGGPESSTQSLTSAFLPLGELTTRQFTQLDCASVQHTSTTTNNNLNSGHQQQTSTTNSQFAAIVTSTGTQIESTSNDAFDFAKPTKVNSTLICLFSASSSCLLWQTSTKPSSYQNITNEARSRSKFKGCESKKPTDWVRRARSFVYHLACFACDQCKRQLSTGEEFALQDCRLLCKQHYMELVEGETGQQKTKTKRVRTTFAEEQLAVLQTHFQIDSNPDGADLERIATMTGLSKRVTQVWFQVSSSFMLHSTVKVDTTSSSRLLAFCS
ncbi:unnamed protein product [Anisakis simplex]|uniref:LIM/homeobox protein Awh (inferred by orthology to a D. melanogaster protein) n=1 Tax=Anisakis simplex TaxID=6269 RepID=A0A0M3K292_ANISI|nr:unnamed protein product [Anisakis simplex]